MQIWGVLVLSYLLGAIPFGFLIARSRGVDIRAVGSGNIGATNVMRVVGKSWGIFTLVLDALKGLGAVYLAGLSSADAPSWFGLACGCAAICGHSFPVYLKFKGGKGVATSAGVLIGVAPAAFGVGIFVFTVVFALFRYVSLGSIAAATAVPIASFLLAWSDGQSPGVTSYALTLLGLVVIWRHRANIRRLLAGTEHRIGRPRDVAPEIDSSDLPGGGV